MVFKIEKDMVGVRHHYNPINPMRVNPEPEMFRHFTRRRN
jgi:hypothetical protein